MCENFKVVIYLVFLYDKIREEKLIFILRMKKWFCRGNILIEWIILDLGNRFFGRIDLYFLWKYRV